MTEAQQDFIARHDPDHATHRETQWVEGVYSLPLADERYGPQGTRVPVVVRKSQVAQGKFNARRIGGRLVCTVIFADGLYAEVWRDCVELARRAS